MRVLCLDIPCHLAIATLGIGNQHRRYRPMYQDIHVSSSSRPGYDAIRHDWPLTITYSVSDRPMGDDTFDQVSLRSGVSDHAQRRGTLKVSLQMGMTDETTLTAHSSLV